MRKRLPAAVVAAGAMAGVIGMSAPTAEAAPAPQYRLVLGSATTLEYRGINAHGDIIGLGTDPSSQGREKGFILKAGSKTPVFLNAPGSGASLREETRALSINDQGMVVGRYGKVVVFPGGVAEVPRPVSWQGPGATGTDLGVNPTGTAEALGVNDKQQIVGTQGGIAGTPWLKQGPTVTNLPLFPGGRTGEALAVNGTGVVVGDAAQANGDKLAAQWVNGNLSSLGSLNGGPSAEALAINTAGQAVGDALPPGAPPNLPHAVLYANGKAVDLNVPGTGTNSARAAAINSHGDIVGEDGVIPPLDLVGSGNGFLYRNGHATELNTLIAPTRNVRLAEATGINDAGHIVGIAAVTAPDGSQSSVGYELVPLSAR
ncbi:hypothetical protein [Amycolatopsis samaneae]|uniref:HAF family extracellular repeat protein n=1 Tax=Amycolatopsis samaneae TaxID=664691 RepID=A0ABW5GNB1_9PSEU